MGSCFEKQKDFLRNSFSLSRISEATGGLFMHCCAAADHQHESFLKIPGFRGLNRLTEFSTKGIRPSIRDFAGKLPLISNPISEQEADGWLAMAEKDSMFFLTIRSTDIEDAKGISERMKKRLEEFPF